ncbi:MAG: RNA polymerase subunit sigma [Deltaproteobacteria bacterium]|nr:MAG: RNA polymerase subunit sigma [Deltaproteobacteria bacterium]
MLVLFSLNFYGRTVSKTLHSRIVNDDELVLRLQRGDEWAFQLLVRRFRQKLFAIAFGITLDAEESQDIVQEVFLQAYRCIASFKGDSSLATWLHRITVNRCLNWKRRWTRRFKWLHVSLDQQDDDAPPLKPVSDLPSPESRVQDAQTQAMIENALKMLPEQARVVFVLREIEGLSYADIAEVAGIKPGTVRSRLFNARKRLRSILQPQMKEER